MNDDKRAVKYTHDGDIVIKDGSGSYTRLSLPRKKEREEEREGRV